MFWSKELVALLLLKNDNIIVAKPSCASSLVILDSQVIRINKCQSVNDD